MEHFEVNVSMIIPSLQNQYTRFHHIVRVCAYSLDIQRQRVICFTDEDSQLRGRNQYLGHLFHRKSYTVLNCKVAHVISLQTTSLENEALRRILVKTNYTRFHLKVVDCIAVQCGLVFRDRRLVCMDSFGAG